MLPHNSRNYSELDSKLVPPSMFDPSRENFACAEDSVLQSGELEPCGTVSQTAAVKVKRSGEEGDGMESTWEISPRPNQGAYRWRNGFFYSQTPSSRCS